VNFDYLTLRLIRHFMPRSLAHFLLRYNLIIKPGAETSAPQEAALRYQQTLAEAGRSLAGQRILDFGYGGNFALACSLLQAGASHVTLLDKFAAPDNRRNRGLLPEYAQYLTRQNGQVIPRHDYIELLEADLHDVADQGRLAPFDIVLSNSVYEHLEDVAGITRSLVRLTAPSGCQVHFIDLRDHYFKYPFEMLTFSDKTWKNWLVPGSHLNRYRLNDYLRVFDQYFTETRPVVLARDPENFARLRSRIKPQFLTGDDQVDSVTLLQIYAADPRTH
jgi:2-polyprenyl-3-methyl-5-hydroxy-6-metoxy-1,4-benzoquinol methylase